MRELFDFVMTDFPETRGRLSESAPIVRSPIFESAIMKVKLERTSLLTHEDLESLQCFENEDLVNNAQSESNISYADRAIFAQKRHSLAERSYHDLRFLMLTYNICERLFSKAGCVLDDRRMGSLPVNLESQILLHLNQDLWSVEDFNSLTSEVKTENTD